MSGRLCYSRMDAGVSGPDKRQGQPGLGIYSSLFHGLSETGACGGGGEASAGQPLFVLSQASTIGQRARGGATGVTDLTFVSVMGVEKRKGGVGGGFRGKRRQ